MARLKVPTGIGAVAHGAYSFTADDAGIIDTIDAPAHVVDSLKTLAGCREATDEDVAAADLKTIGADLEAGAKTEKAGLIEELAALGVTADQRTTIKGLRKLLEAKKAGAVPKADPAKSA